MTRLTGTVNKFVPPAVYAGKSAIFAGATYDSTSTCNLRYGEVE